MPTKINTNALQSQVQQWARSQNIDKPVHDLSLRQMQTASRALGVELSDVIALREAAVVQAGGGHESAGAAFQANREAAKGGKLGYGGVRSLKSSPVMRGFGLEVGKGRSSKKGGGFVDGGAAMQALGSTLGAKGAAKQAPYLEYKGYRGGSSDIDAFWRSGYSTLDADKAVEAFSFLRSRGEAMEYIGLKVNNGAERMLAEVGITRSPFDKHEELAAFADSGYSTRDAKAALRAFPFLHSLEDAKSYIGLKVLNGTEQILDDVGIHRDNEPGSADYRRFLASDYSVDDAERALAAFDFCHTVLDAKEYIGMKIDNGTEDILRDVGVYPSKGGADGELRAFALSAYSIDDAEQAMKAFGLSSLQEGKAFIGAKIRSGAQELLGREGITPHDFDDHECASAFQRSGYSEVDARMALTVFDFLDSVEQAKEYIGLKIVNGTESLLSEVGITQRAFDGHECIQAFQSAGYTDADATKAQRGWDFLGSKQEAREYIGLKVLNGWESLLHEVGVTPRNPDRVWDGKGGVGYVGKK